MNKTDKFIKKLTKSQRLQLDNSLRKLYEDQLSALDIKKLTGSKDIFRLRVGRIRVIYSKRNDKIKIILITNRDDKTYKDF